MPLSAGTSFLIILLVALTTFATRVIPFLVFPKGKEIPKTIHGFFMMFIKINRQKVC